MMLHVKVVNYQHNIAPHWCFDSILPVFKIAVIFRIVGRNNGTEDVFENLLVCTCIRRRRIYNGKQENATMAAASSPQRVRYTVINLHVSLFSIVVSISTGRSRSLEKRLTVPNGELRRGAHLAYIVVYYHLAANGWIITGDELYMIHKT